MRPLLSETGKAFDAIRSRNSALAGASVIALVAMVTYLPALKIGFLDGWWYLEWAAKFDIPRYVIQFLDPRNITQGYRPVQGMYILAQYLLFGFNPDGYHIVQTLFHAANCILLYLVVWRLGKNRRVGLLAALLYAVSPVYSLAVFWHAVVDPLAAFFYLLTILLWCEYLEGKNSRLWWATLAAYLLALLSKEVAFFLWFILFLVERWFYGRKSEPRTLLREYGLFILVLFPYVWLELAVQGHGEFVGQFGFKLGPHMATNLLAYLAVLTFPWTTHLPGDLQYVWLGIVVVFYLGVMVYRRSKAMLFLAGVAILNILPLTGFPLNYFDTRYLYFSLMASAVVLAVMVENGFRVFAQRAWSIPAISLVVALLLVGNAWQVTDAATGLAEYTRQLRVPFRDISRLHPSFPEDSFLYFVYSPKTPLVDLQGLFMTRYGIQLKVSGTEVNAPAGLREHKVSFAYYFDETAKPHEIPVSPTDPVLPSSHFPVAFDVPIRLEGYEVVNPVVQRGDPLILLLYWRTVAQVDKDYSVFVHLLDDAGRVVAGYDSQPRRGESPTSKSRVGQLVVDAIVLHPPTDVTIGEDYRLELGLYDQPTMQRSLVVNEAGDAVSDHVTLAPIGIR